MGAIRRGGKYAVTLYELYAASPLGAGFTVGMWPVKKGRMIDRIHFTISKIDERRGLGDAMQGKSKKNSSREERPLLATLRLSTTDYEKAKAAAPGWDVYYLEREWREWIAKKGAPENPGAAFIAFCRKKYQG